MSDGIHEEVLIDAAPARVYGALTDATEFSKLSGGAPAEIAGESGGAFSCFGGMILGRNVECVPGERIVQAWRVKNWEPGLYSIVRFELRSEGKGTRVVLSHRGFPAEQVEHLRKGWYSNYLDPLKKLASS